jgi:phospholipid/cholesterol/gamma-HCH transport system substrate-binding protein
METNVNYTIVGVFVISLMAVTIFTIIWLSSGFSSNVTKMYKVYMTESVSGLNIDSPVERC